MLKKIGIIVNYKKDVGLKITKRIIKRLQQDNVIPMVTNKIGSLINKKDLAYSPSYIGKNADIIIVLGGDGTFLGVSRNFAKYNPILLPVNIGDLGFIAEINKKILFSKFKKIINSGFSVESRILLESKILKKNITSKIAANDILISQNNFSRLMKLTLFINGKYCSNFRSDGLIISTPTGSTGHSLSAGAPIINPNVEVLLITPLCAHSLSVRPLVISVDSTITIKFPEEDNKNLLMTIDGQEQYSINPNNEIMVKKANNNIKIIKVNSKSFYDLLREKLYWKGY